MADTMTSLTPAEGRRVVLPEGCLSLDGLPLARGTDMPAEGAQVPKGVWSSRCVMRGDAQPLPAAPARAGKPAAPAASTGAAA